MVFSGNPFKIFTYGKRKHVTFNNNGVQKVVVYKIVHSRTQR